MPQARHVWSLVLAGGDGTRLRALTTRPCGTSVPKQYCSLHGGHSLLEDAIARAQRVVAPDRVCTIVAQQHREWWTQSRPLLDALEHGNLIVQPRNLGTGIGILYSLLHILAKDSQALVVMLPADHYVRDEDTLHAALVQALQRLDSNAERPVLLGLQPDEPDTDLGYVLPGDPDPFGGRTVARFMEKPGYSVAREIIDAGGLWNTFIMVASARVLLDLYMPRFAPLVMEMQVGLAKGDTGSPTGSWPALLALYDRLPELDFSRDLLEGRAAELCVLRVPPCGWSDLGTPRRVGEIVRRFASDGMAAQDLAGRLSAAAHINLAAQHAHFVSTNAQFDQLRLAR